MTHLRALHAYRNRSRGSLCLAFNLQALFLLGTWLAELSPRELFTEYTTHLTLFSPMCKILFFFQLLVPGLLTSAFFLQPLVENSLACLRPMQLTIVVRLTSHFSKLNRTLRGLGFRFLNRLKLLCRLELPFSNKLRSWDNDRCNRDCRLLPFIDLFVEYELHKSWARPLWVFDFLDI